MAIGLAQPCPAAGRRQVTVFDPVAHLLGRAGAGVGADVRFRANLATPGDKLVRAERVGVFDAPGLVIARLALVADAMQPVVGADKAAPRPAHDGHAQFAQSGDHVGAETIRISQRGARVEDAAVDLAVEMLEKLAKEHAVVWLAAAMRVDVNGGGDSHQRTLISLRSLQWPTWRSGTGTGRLGTGEWIGTVEQL